MCIAPACHTSFTMGIQHTVLIPARVNNVIMVDKAGSRAANFVGWSLRWQQSHHRSDKYISSTRLMQSGLCRWKAGWRNFHRHNLKLMIGTKFFNPYKLVSFTLPIDPIDIPKNSQLVHYTFPWCVNTPCAIAHVNFLITRQQLWIPSFPKARFDQI